MALVPSRLLPSWLNVFGELIVGVVGVVVSPVAAKPEPTVVPAVKKAAKPIMRIAVMIGPSCQVPIERRLPVE
jgi:hypothetical protein